MLVGLRAEMSVEELPDWGEEGGGRGGDGREGSNGEDFERNGKRKR